MTTFESSTRTLSRRHDPAAAVAAIASEAKALAEAAACAWLAAAARDDQAAVAAFVREWTPHVAWRAHFLRSTLHHLPDTAPRAAVQRCLGHELGHLTDVDCAQLRRVGISPRPLLGVGRPHWFAQFAQAVGSGAEPASAAAERSRTRLLQLLTQASPTAAFGAFAFGIEAADRTLQRAVLRHLLAAGALRRDAMLFFETAAVAAPAIEHDLLQVATALASDAGAARELAEGMRSALLGRSESFAAMAPSA